MTSQDDPHRIVWRLHLSSSPELVYSMLDSDDGRAQFWAESAIEADGHIEFLFPNGWRWRGRILERIQDRMFSVVYIGDSVVTFMLEHDGDGGTDLTLSDEGVAAEYRSEVTAGWVSVLMALKSAADFSLDIRNHDPDRTWDQGYVEN